MGNDPEDGDAEPKAQHEWRDAVTGHVDAGQLSRLLRHKRLFAIQLDGRRFTR